MSHNVYRNNEAVAAGATGTRAVLIPVLDLIPDSDFHDFLAVILILILFNFESVQIWNQLHSWIQVQLWIWIPP